MLCKNQAAHLERKGYVCDHSEHNEDERKREYSEARNGIPHRDGVSLGLSQTRNHVRNVKVVIE